MAKQFKQLLIAVLAAHWVGGAIADEHGHHAFPKDVDAFHAVLAPVWHARPGPERSQDACGKADRMESLAKEIRSRDASALVASVAALKQQCQAKPGEIDGALHDVHEAFHRLIDVRPGLSQPVGDHKVGWQTTYSSIGCFLTLNLVLPVNFTLDLTNQQLES